VSLPAEYASAQTSLAADRTEAWQAFTAQERETFFAAIARHRHMAWRVTAISSIAIVLCALIVATLSAPLFYAVMALTLDLMNLLRPAPDLIGHIMSALDTLQRSEPPVPASAWVQFAAWTALPGLMWVALLLFALRRALRQASSFDATELRARAPNPQVLAEQRLANVITEMSIAAGLPPPRVMIAERAAMNAAVFGTDDQHATIVISQSLLARLDRDEMQGVAAHLVGSIANGDVAIGMRSSLVVSFFGVFARLATVLTSERAHPIRSLLAFLRPMVWPTRAAARKLIESLNDPFADEPAKDDRVDTDNRPQLSQRMQKVRGAVMLVLAGPVVITGFFGGIVGSFVLGSMLSFAWRQRKYLADATAVRLTRDPDTLSQALEKIAGAGGGGSLEPWADHMAVSNPVRSQSRFGVAVPMFPSVERRLAALQNWARPCSGRCVRLRYECSCCSVSSAWCWPACSRC
jgi:Zn-dependent protease with chaperone function